MSKILALSKLFEKYFSGYDDSPLVNAAKCITTSNLFLINDVTVGHQKYQRLCA